MLIEQQETKAVYHDGSRGCMITGSDATMNIYGLMIWCSVSIPLLYDRGSVVIGTWQCGIHQAWICISQILAMPARKQECCMREATEDIPDCL
jgi:hypothetical protein